MSATLQVRQRITMLPAVSFAEHGPNKQFCINEVFNEDGQLVWQKSPRGYLTYFAYDGATGALKQRIEDADRTKITDPVSAPDFNAAALPGPRLHLITDYEIDPLGRVTKVLGPRHAVQLSEGDTTTTQVRRCDFHVYRCIFRERWHAIGYAVGNTYTTEGLVEISKLDGEGRVIESIGALRASNAGAPSNAESFPRSTWQRWQTFQLDTWGRPQSSRLYHLIPSEGSGEPGTNYNQTHYAYDKMGRVVRMVDSSGTITRTVYNHRGLALSRWIGTDDTSATDKTPPMAASLDLSRTIW